MKIGILGGTYNPIHRAHITMALRAIDTFGLDKVLLMVAALPPHKSVARAVPGQTRLEMTRLAVEGIPGLEACGLELERTGKSYTYDTICALKELYPGAEFYFIIGSDMLTILPTWYRIRDLAGLVHFAVVPRIGEEAEDAANMEAARRELGAVITPFFAKVPPYSSTQVRERVFHHLPIHKLVPEAVERYIYREGLYQEEAFSAIRERLQAMLKPSRFAHTMGVVQQAVLLSDLHENGDAAFARKAAMAALLHDCAKNMPEALLGILSGDDYPEIAPVQHALAGAVVAHDLFGITDGEVLQAIRRHCTGDAGMTLLDKLIYLADLTEPGREFEGVELYRMLSYTDPDAALREHLAWTVKRIGAEALHPATLRAARDLGVEC